MNFHGYPSAVASLLFSRASHVSRSRFIISKCLFIPFIDFANSSAAEGYQEQGTTTTPYSMLRLNSVGRFDVAEAAVRYAAANSTKFDTDAHVLITYFQHQNRVAEKYALENGEDASWFGGQSIFRACGNASIDQLCRRQDLIRAVDGTGPERMT